MSESTFGRKKATASPFSHPSLVSPTTPTLANPTQGFGLPTNNVIQTATEVSTDQQQAQSADEQSLEQQAIPEKPITHDISRISLHRPQAKLTVGEPGDKYEQEADMMANRVMSMAAPTVQREAISEDEEAIQTKSLNTSIQREVLQKASNGDLQAGDSIENQLNSSKGGGSPLADEVRSFMEPRFGADFSQVRVHTDREAVQMNRELSAQAFTHRSDVYFGEGQSPGNNELTAHELTHVVQQAPEIENIPLTENINKQALPISFDSPHQAVIQRSFREDMHGNWQSALIELNSAYADRGGVIDRQMRSVQDFTDAIREEDSPSLGEQVLLGGINLLLGAAFGGIGTVLKSVASRALRPALRGVTQATMGTAVDSSELRGTLRSSVNSIIDKVVEAGQEKVQAAVSQAWSNGGADAPNPIQQFRQTQMQALETIAREQVRTMNIEMARLIGTEGEEDEWEVADALYASFQQSLQQVYNEQYNKMTDSWFRMQTQSIGLGARPGVLNIELETRYPHQGRLEISGGNLLGSGANESIRNRLANRPLEEISIPKVIRMNGSMGYGILDCDWWITVTGEMSSSQMVTRLAGNRWGLPWLAAYHLSLSDLDRGDERNSLENQMAGAREVWNAIKTQTCHEIGSSSW